MKLAGEDRNLTMEEALRASEERYRMLLDGIQDYDIFAMDLQGRIASWNAGAERIKGYRADQIIGRNFSCFFPPADILEGKPAGPFRTQPYVLEPVVIQITPQMRVLVAVAAVDGRKGTDALAQLCREKLAADPFSGCVFIFRRLYSRSNSVDP